MDKKIKINSIDNLIDILNILKESDFGSLNISNLKIDIRTDLSSGYPGKKIIDVEMSNFKLNTKNDKS